MMPFIQVDRLSHVPRPAVSDATGTPHSAPTLFDVSFSVREGEYLAVIGNNGSGKTTLVRHLNGLLLPSSGDVFVDGKSVKDPANLASIRTLVGMVFQSPEDQIVGLTVESDAAFGPENLGLSAETVEERVARSLGLLGILGERRRSPHALSAGQQQRLAIAGTLAMNPRCIVLDEAGSMLDPSGRSDLASLLRSLHAGGLTIIAVTNHIEEAAAADRLLVLDGGRLLFDGEPERIFADPKYTALGLGVPAAARISSKIRSVYPGFIHGAVRSSGNPAADLVSSVERAIGPSMRAPKAAGAAGTYAAAVPAGVPEIVLRVVNLSHTYLNGFPDAKRSLSGINLVIRRGECVALLGGTGSGKSTLLQHLNGLLRAQEGSVEVLGIDPSGRKADLKTLRFAAGLAFQRPEDQLFEHYLGEDIAFGPMKQGLPGAAVRDRVSGAMERTGLAFETFKYRPVAGLSGGEKRRGGLAGVLALEPEILLLDEPAAGLDPSGRERMLGILRDLKNAGKTLVVVSHSLEDISRLADRVLVLKDGRIVREGPAREVLSDAGSLRAAGLEPPFPVAVRDELASRGFTGIPGKLITEEEVTDLILGLFPGAPV